MAKGRRIPDEKRQAIIDDLRQTIETPEGSYGKIAKRNGVSTGTVQSIAKAIGVKTPEARLIQNKTAIELHTATLAQRRAAISERLLGVAEKTLGMMDGPYLVFNFGGKDNTYNQHLLEGVPSGDLKALATALGIVLDKHKMLEHFDSDIALGSAVDRWIAHMNGEENG
jgi:hypothetical protein